ncbi:cation:proton antiporter [Mastigocoleus testarum]|uniref:Sodium:proton antiporter n=1 Tax=Mastigocoleus testarum BC008 TaxID=371196 RepID=A0A0V7ZN49_9CYAN|nr:cation:proton antiporter [Mastigocoleus testarum]KST65702.1 sodium:proton antiporter [Mastigocoleus testarum BC008]
MLNTTVIMNHLELDMDLSMIPILQRLPNLFLIEGTEGGGEEKAAIAAMIATAGIIFIFSLILGEICTRLKLPSVLGDLVSGILLGGSILGILIFSTEGTEANSVLLRFLQFITGVSSETMEQAYNFQMKEFLDESANIGLLTLLFTTGLESNLKELIRVGTQAVTVAFAGVIFPFTLGTLALIKFFAIGTIPALFAGAALTATSIGITAKVLQDIGSLKSDEGQIILGAAILDDILGIIILAVVLSLVQTGEIEVINVIYLLISAASFILGTIFLNHIFGSIFVATIKKINNPAALMLLAVIFLNSCALLATSIGLEAILGAFAAGLVLGETEFQKKIQELFEPFIFVYTTIFFVTVGARVDLSVLNPTVAANHKGLIIAACLIIIAIIGKVIAGFLVFADRPINRLAIGAGMIPRGEVGLVFAGLGVTTGALSNSLGAAIVVMVIVTTLIAPIILNYVFPRYSSKLDDSKDCTKITERDCLPISKFN